MCPYPSSARAGMALGGAEVGAAAFGLSKASAVSLPSLTAFPKLAFLLCFTLSFFFSLSFHQRLVLPEKKFIKMLCPP